jgi:hypothetical protein
MRQLASPYPFAYLSVRGVSKNEGRVFVKFAPGELYKNSRHIQFGFQSNKLTDISLEFLNSL